MNARDIIEGIASLGALIVSLYVAFANRRTAADTARVAGASAAIEGYARLCASLQEQIDRNNEEIGGLRQELEEIRRDREALQRRIAFLEEENAELRRRLDALQERQGNGHS